MTTFKRFASFVLAATMVPALHAKTNCPGNVESVPLRVLNGYQMFVAVSINHSGPFEFLLDTGTQTTTVDPSIVAELGLATLGVEKVAGIGFEASASSAQLDLLEAGSHAVTGERVLVYSLHSLQSVGLNIRGVLGEDFLEHFDVLIDYTHTLLCLDDSQALRTGVKGPHIPLVMPAPAADGTPLSRSLIVESRLSDSMRPVRLWLDSGSNVPFLYNPSEYLARRTSRNAPQEGTGGNGQQQVYVALPLQKLRIGPLELPNIAFFTFARTSKDSRVSEFDGVLTTGLFRLVFICHADRFVVLEPR